MTDLRKAAEMALEALDWRFSNVPEASEALRQALAQPEQEPWVSLSDEEIENLELPNKPTVKEFVRFIEAALRSKNDPTSN